MKFLMVGLGGGLGAMLRYAVSLLPYKGTFPVLTLATNLTGAIFIGFIAAVAGNKNLSENSILFWKTGICGGYTTFSTFSLEAYRLFEDGRTGLAVVYLILSVAGCLAGVWLGSLLAGAVEHL